MRQFTLRPKKDKSLFKNLSIIFLILSFILCTVTADETIEKSIKLINKSDKTFFTFVDDENERFEHTIEFKKGEKKSTYIISRINIDGPYYDGIMGYNVFKIRKDSFPTPVDVLTLMVRGQFRLFGYDIEKNKIYAYRSFQIGTDFLIKNIAVMSNKKRKEKNNTCCDENPFPDEIDIEVIGPPGEYIYASCSPDGKYCLLFGETSTLIDLHRKEVLKEDLGLSFPTPGCFDFLIVTYDLSGEFLEMKWETNTSGNLICRDKNKKVAKVVKIDIKKMNKPIPKVEGKFGK